MGLPKASDWNKYSEVLNAGIRGFNALVKIPEIIQKEIPEFKRFAFGFCDRDDVPEWRTMGWIHLRTDMFDIEEWNKSIGLRFGLVDDGGLVKFRDNFIMIMDKDYRKRLENVRNEESEKDFSRAVEGSTAYSHPSDPRHDEMMKASRELSELSTARVQVEGAAESGAEPKKRGPGRPRKQ